jgi:hypothetical protein
LAAFRDFLCVFCSIPGELGGIPDEDISKPVGIHNPNIILKAQL